MSQGDGVVANAVTIEEKKNSTISNVSDNGQVLILDLKNKNFFDDHFTVTS